MSVTTELRIGDLYAAIKRLPPLSPDDTLAKAVRLFRARSTPVLLVAEGPRLVGLVYEADLLRLASQSGDARAFLRGTPLSQGMRSLDLVLSTHQTLSEAARALTELDLPAAPVTAPGDHYLGLILRGDLLAALAGEPIPVPVGGLATPFGVRLTTGALAAGAGNLALASNGVALALLSLLTNKGLGAAGVWAHRTWTALDSLAPSGSLGAAIEGLLLGAIPLALFLLLLRLSSISAIHGAEHMVVHAIEEGEDLVLEKVRPMPRVHPRCGTNAVALLALIVLGEQVLLALNRLDQAAGGLMLLALVVIVLLTWRRLGHGLQRLISTKPPSDRQLARAIGVGEDLLAQIAAHPGARAGFFRRLWNSGFPQVLAGFLFVSGLAYGAEWLLRLRAH